MSRVIKFRVWDTRTNAYRHNCNERLSFISGPGTHSLGRFEFALAELFKNQDSIHEQEFVSPYFNGPILIPEQFTGLLGKTGREIYEGDIVKTDPTHFNALLKATRESDRYTEYTAGKVEWWNEGFAVCQAYIGATRISEYAACDCCPCGLEIIGNIHENPDLLKS